MLSSLFPFAVRTPALDALTREVDRIIQTSAPAQPRWPGAQAPAWPGLNIWRDGDTIVAEAELPGFKMEDVEVLSTETSLTLRGQRSSNIPEGATALRVERRITSFERSLELPIPIRPDAVEATLASGVLRITMPIAEAVKPRRVVVKAITPDPQRAAFLEGAASPSVSSAK